MIHSFDAFVVAALFAREGSVFCLGDGSIRFEGERTIQAHDGAVLCAAPHPSGSGVITGGDDGRVVWSRPEGSELLAEVKGKWIDAVASEPAGLIAFATGRGLHVRDVKDPAFARTFQHERSVAALAFDPKGRRIAAATYGGVAQWFARIVDQRPQMLKWAGSHVAVAFSPDARFIVSAMQENALHGWRLQDGRDMRMGGYPAKPRSLVFLSGGQLLATSGANGVVVWPFGGANGPMGREAAEIGADDNALVTRVAAAADGHRVVAGLDDGRVWSADLTGRGVSPLKAERGAAITALAVSLDGRYAAWGDEGGEAGISELPA